MNRLQKKCVIATAGIHLLLLTILLVGPAFFNAKPKADDSQVLDVIPANLIDEAFNSGVKNAQPPAPTPMIVPQPQPTPPAPKPVEQSPTFVDRVKNIFTPEPKPEPEKQTPKPRENSPHKIQPNLIPVVRNAPKNSKADNSRNVKAIDNALKNLRHNLSSATEITLPGNSSVAYANYASVVKSVYDAAWTLPEMIAKDENITVSVTIASDGTVISSHIISRSGDAPADDSVQRTLDRVQFVAPFPEGTTEKQRTFTIVFNPQVKQSE